MTLVAGPAGVWSSASLVDFATYIGAPYMYRIENAQGATVYRTDLHSRWQIGRGSTDPSNGRWDGDPATLDAPSTLRDRGGARAAPTRLVDRDLQQ